MKKKVAIIGSGFASLSASCYLAKAGFEVAVYEKNTEIGGRARQLKKDGFCFDIGPTWYWMPDVFERFFSDFGKMPSDYYNLEKLNPAYKIFFGKNEIITIEDTLEKICLAFEAEEPGSSKKLKQFIKDAKTNYEIAIKDLVYRPGISPMELLTPKTAGKIRQFFSTISREVQKEFANPKLIQILEFPVLFLGAKAGKTPAFYSFMNYADFGLGTWHPQGGMHKVIEAIESLALSLGVSLNTNSRVSKIFIEKDTASGIQVNNRKIKADYILSGADYHHTETLLPEFKRQYKQSYWQKKTFAPSALLFFVGFNKKLENISHHTLFFDTDFEKHAKAIYDDARWPEDPLFYASFPSVTDRIAAPENKEAGIFLIPLAPDVEDNQEIRNRYFKKIISRLENLTNQNLTGEILFKESFCVNDFKEEYNSYKGNAYGLANTLLQTAFLRPKLKSKKVHRLFFTGQLSVPGPGVPPSLISGKLAAGLIQKED